MKKMIRFTILLALILLSNGCTAYRNYAAKIEINAESNSYNLTTSMSSYVLILPKSNFQPVKPLGGGGTDNPRYFIFRNEKSKLNVSGWFEPLYLYPGQKKYLEQLSNELEKNGRPLPENVNHFQHNKWRVTSYEIPCNGNYSTNINAHFYEEDTWIDLHISYDCGRGNKLNDLLSYLDTIK
ncbi:hypothetical protein ACFL9T_03025 [Thermodesulfobacteriota bacterium]